MKGRKYTLKLIKDKILENDKVIWIHAASLGEYEQGLPIMQELKKEYTNFKIVLTFFSPSGFEVKKDSPYADVIAYLPLDSKKNVQDFLNMTHPELVIFIKYEIWPNYLKELKKRAIPIFLISSIFKENQVFFKWYGRFMRQALEKFTFIFVQNKKSMELLANINIRLVEITGDTRLDRVLRIKEQDNTLSFMENFKQDNLCFIAGSTWPEDENILVDYINNHPNNFKYVIAPHTIKNAHIKTLKQSINTSVSLYSELDKMPIENSQVLIIDTIGLLTKIYNYADIAYVGGAFATGLHNTLEPAVFGIPVLIGPKYKGFAEAEALVEIGGIKSIKEKKGFEQVMQEFYTSATERAKVGKINKEYIESNSGATLKIMSKINFVITP